MQQQGAERWSISDTSAGTQKTSASAFSFLFNAVWNTQAEKKTHNGWHRMVSTFPEDITDARSSEQLGARLKDTTDSPNIATFNPEAAAL